MKNERHAWARAFVLRALQPTSDIWVNCREYLGICAIGAGANSPGSCFGTVPDSQSHAVAHYHPAERRTVRAHLGQGCCFTMPPARIAWLRERGEQAEKRHAAPDSEPPKRGLRQTAKPLRSVWRHHFPAGMVRVSGPAPRAPSVGCEACGYKFETLVSFAET